MLSRITLLALVASIIFLFLLFSFSTPGPTTFGFHLYPPPSSPQPSKLSRLGRWEQSISLPIVPVAIAVLPRSGNVLVWAADKANVFSSATTHTLSAIYNPSTHAVSEHNVSVTHHNMFCPGLSMDTSGRVVVTGGSTANHTSIYDDAQGRWVPGSGMTMGRGYHAQATLSDGRIFTIGGSWSGPLGGKHGELLDPIRSTWSPLPNTVVEPMLTHDDLGVFAADNHAWLFAWKNSSVFQAGPSTAMNWYGTDSLGNGSHVSAGPRGQDGDSMNGNAVLYDAVAGKILTVGGAPSYTDSPSSNAAHVITLSQTPFEKVNVQKIDSMRFPRAYANSVVLPTGDVLVTGGATWARQWADANATLVPELWSHTTQRFSTLAEMPVPRTYHSVAVLLPDATVLTGGGGLCWEKCIGPEEEINHKDLQRYTPPYLFAPDVQWPRGRRYTATHAINTDQRRLALKPHPLESHRYSLIIPEDSGVVIPGYWMLFAIKGGVPSIAQTVLIMKQN
ncbi:hypothetical protein QBC35DRAFT_519936 [Podospora australis]|uniref:Galactose oxidase n=1 Tax=Podospora australis TaxID=1536484 RepID=A0AAN6X2Y7_9PEZI|nr:hypothetical protein QBC35DRAFT_519936 [Podospora australis]